MSLRSFDEIFEVSVTRATSNTLVRISACSSWVAIECDENHFVTAPTVICLSAAKSSFPFLLRDHRTSLVVDDSPEVEVEEPHENEASAKRLRSQSTTHPISSMS